MIPPQSISAFSAQPSRNISSFTQPRVRLLVSEPERKWRKHVEERLKFLVEDLAPNWDGYGGRRVSLLNALFALRMLEATCGDDAPVPQIVPGHSGDLQIEWHTSLADVELHVQAPNHVHAWRKKCDERSDEEELQLDIDFLRVSEWIEELSETTLAARPAAIR